MQLREGVAVAVSIAGTPLPWQRAGLKGRAVYGELEQLKCMPVYWEQRNYLAKAVNILVWNKPLFSFQDVSPALEVKCSLEKPVVRFSLGSH